MKPFYNYETIMKPERIRASNKRLLALRNSYITSRKSITIVASRIKNKMNSFAVS